MIERPGAGNRSAGNRGAAYVEYIVLAGVVALLACQAFLAFGHDVARVIAQHIVVISGIGF